MPFKINEVEKHRKGLNTANKKKWLQVANGILKSCMEKGGSELSCEVTAIRTANGSFSDDRKSAEEYSNMPNALSLEDHDGKLELMLSEVDEEEYQLVFPVGTFITGKYGEINVTENYVNNMVKNWKQLGNDSCFLDKDHRFEESYGWPEDIKADEDGIKVKWNFTDDGKKLIENKSYKFFSSAIGYSADLKTGEELYPVLRAVTLCNSPVMSTLPEVHLSENPTHREGKNNIEEGLMTLSEIITALLSLSDEDKKGISNGNKKDIADVFGLSMGVELSEANQKIGVQDEKLKLILSENQDMAKSLKEIKDKNHADQKIVVIEAAIKEGKILPKNKEKYEALYDKDPEGIAELLKEKGSEVNLGEVGTGAGGLNATDEDIAAAKMADMELAEFMKLTYGEDK